VISTSKSIRDVAEAYGIGTGTSRHWLIKYRCAKGGTETELTVPERARLKEFEREVQELKAEAQFIKKAAATYDKQGELTARDGEILMTALLKVQDRCKQLMGIAG